MHIKSTNVKHCRNRYATSVLTAVVALVVHGFHRDGRWACVYAAGSVRQVLTELIGVFRAAADKRPAATCGPSGELQQEIEQGSASAVSAAAAIEHHEALFKVWPAVVSSEQQRISMHKQ